LDKLLKEDDNRSIIKLHAEIFPFIDVPVDAVAVCSERDHGQRNSSGSCDVTSEELVYFSEYCSQTSMLLTMLVHGATTYRRKPHERAKSAVVLRDFINSIKLGTGTCPEDTLYARSHCTEELVSCSLQSNGTIVVDNMLQLDWWPCLLEVWPTLLVQLPFGELSLPLISSSVLGLLLIRNTVPL
jgi:hypothetical protein